MPPHEDNANVQRRIERIKALGDGSYLDVRALEDGTIVGIGRLLYTTAVYVDMNEWGWSQRFCFDDRELAASEYQKLKTKSDEPSGWIARRPQQ